MHSTLILASLVLALGGGRLCTTVLPGIPAAGRRAVQLLGLILPVAVLGLLAAVMLHFLSQVCFVTAPPWDVILAQTLALLGAVAIAAALLLNLLRVSLLPWHLQRRTWPAPAPLAVQVTTVGAALGVRRLPQVRVAVDPQPWALVAGLRRPTLALSSGLVALLDPEELEAVLAHELLHLRRGDLWWTVASGVLRDLTWFLPATRALYAQFRAEQEVACDDAVSGPRRRLALASALARVWQTRLNATPAPRGALTLLAPLPEGADLLEARVRRLLTQPDNQTAASPRATLFILGGVFGALVVTQGSLILLAMDAMGCGPHDWLALLS